MRRSTAGWRAVAAAPSSWWLGSRAGERLHGEAIKLIQDLLYSRRRSRCASSRAISWLRVETAISTGREV